MFYFYFQSRRKTNDPVVLWMTGGPGCSSELAIFYENGPYSINHNMTLTETEYGWDRYHNMIFVDQPINTGFSYSDDERDRVHNEKGVGEDMLDFLYAFYEAHPELADLPFFVTGESYAGHYVPTVAHRVWLANKNKEGPHINLQGIAIGNGLTEPEIQFGAYADYALMNNLISQGLRDSIQFWFPLCKFGAKFCDKYGWEWACGFAMQICMVTTFGRVLGANPGINVYDITRKCEGQLCYDFTDADKFLNMASTRKALGVGDREWVGCNMDVYADMIGDWLHNFDTIIPEMMADGVRTMIYAGDLDLICNWLGNYRWVSALDWEGQADWNASPDKDWEVHGGSAGSVRQFGPLSFVKVAKAGHMVPMDQPANALVMITAFTRNQPLTSIDPGTRVSTVEDAVTGSSVRTPGKPLSAHAKAALQHVLERLADTQHQPAAESKTGALSMDMLAKVKMQLKKLVTRYDD